MTKENLWQVIIGMLVTSIFGVLLPMKWAAIFPAFLVAIIWAGIKQTSGKKYPNKDGEMVEPKFWKDFRANIYEVNGQTSPPLTLTGVYTWDTP